MENVFYILGAGFSAPLSLPVMSNFLMKSKDMYFSDPERLQHFQEIFNIIKDDERHRESIRPPLLVQTQY